MGSESPAGVHLRPPTSPQAEQKVPGQQRTAVEEEDGAEAPAAFEGTKRGR